MSESSGEALIIALLKTVTGFSATNVSYGNWKLLNTGKSDHYAIVKPGQFTREQLTMSANVARWNTIVEIWQRYKDDATSLESLRTHIDNVSAKVAQYRKLGDTTNTVIDATVTSGSEVQEQWRRGGGLSWIRRDLVITWSEYEAVTYAE